MKKIVLSIAGVMAAAAFAPEASAIPAFARQTGMACSACHAQHYPVLNGFGRAFKAAGYTMMGAQEKVEGEHLSIPATLNAAMLAKVRYQKDNSNNTRAAAMAGVGPNTANNGLGDGAIQFGEEFSLFFGGRVAENIGFIFEGNLAAGNAANGMLATLRLPIVFPMGDAKLSLVPFTTDANGVATGYELSSGGVLRVNRWSDNRRDTSAIQYNADRGNDGGAATGFAFVAQNDMGFINVTKWAPSFAMGGNQGGVASYDMKSTYVRIAATPTIGDWAIVTGIGAMSGTSLTGAGIAAANVAQAGAGTLVDTKQSFFDFQAHGEVAGKELGVYFQYASAPATVNGNAYNAAVLAAPAAGTIGAHTRTAWTLGADYTVIPHVLSLGAAYRHADTGAAVNAANLAAGRGNTNKAVNLSAVYDLTQNVALHLNQTFYSGNDLVRTAATVAANVVNTIPAKSATLITLEAAW